ncbi:MAG: hypothetical protein AAFV86_16405 [Pseudomonadota bacterium]
MRSSHRRQLRRIHRRFGRDAGGAISFEFAVTFPLLMLLLISSFAFFDAFRTNALMAKIGYAINDIVSRFKEASPAAITEMALLQRKMTPFNVSAQQIRITNICMGPNGFRVFWSASEAEAGTTPLPILTDATIPLDIMPVLAEQESVMLTEIRGTWAPLIDGFGLTDREFSSELVIRPRFVRMMPHTTLAPGTPICPG